MGRFLIRLRKSEHGASWLTLTGGDDDEYLTPERPLDIPLRLSKGSIDSQIKGRGRSFSVTSEEFGYQWRIGLYGLMDFLRFSCVLISVALYVHAHYIYFFSTLYSFAPCARLTIVPTLVFVTRTSWTRRTGGYKNRGSLFTIVRCIIIVHK